MIIDTIGFSSAQDALSKLQGSGHILINTLADTCQACAAFKEHIPTLSDLAKSKGVQVYNIKADNTNTEFFEKYQCETLPYTFCFKDGNFIGGDSFDENSYVQLLNALGEINVSE